VHLATARSWAGGLNTSRLRRLGGESALIVVGQVAAGLGSLVATRVFTALLRPSTYGQIALAMTLATLLQLLLFGPLAMGCLRFFAVAREQAEFDSYLHAVRRLSFQASLGVLGVISLLLIGMNLAGQARWSGLIAATGVYSLVYSYGSLLDGMQNAARQRAIVAWHQGIGQWMRVACVTALVGTCRASASVVMLGQALAAGVVLVSQFVFFRRRIRTASYSHGQGENGPLVEKWAKAIRGYSRPFASWSIFAWIQSSSDRWLLQRFAGSGEVGRYAVLYQLGYSPILLMSNLVTQLVTPVLFARAGDASEAKRMQSGRRLIYILLAGCLLLSLVATGVAFLTHRWLFSILTAAEYRPASWLLPVLVLGGGIFAAGQMAALVPLSGIKSKVLMAPKIGGACAGVLVTFVGARWFGLTGVAFALVGSSLIYLLWVVHTVRATSSGNSSGPQQQAGSLSR